MTKETGFLPNLLVTTKYLVKNPVSDPPLTMTKETGFLPNLLVTTKDFIKKNRFLSPINYDQKDLTKG
jgi:hypothetical protein